MSAVLLWLLIGIDMCYFLPIDQKIANEGPGGSADKVDYYYYFSNAGVDWNHKMKFMIIWLLQKLWQK